MARPHSALMEGGLGHGYRAVCCLHRGVRTSHSAVHMLPEVCDYIEKLHKLSLSGE